MTSNRLKLVENMDNKEIHKNHGSKKGDLDYNGIEDMLNEARADEHAKSNSAWQKKYNLLRQATHDYQRGATLRKEQNRIDSQFLIIVKEKNPQFYEEVVKELEKRLGGPIKKKSERKLDEQ